MADLEFVARVARTVIAIAGLFGSILVISCVLRFSKLRTITNKYILNLTIACLCNCITTALSTIQANFYESKWQFSEITCTLNVVSVHVNTFAFGFFLAIICVDRYLVMVWPASRTWVVANVVISATWMASILLSIPAFIYTGLYDGYCYASWPVSDNYSGSDVAVVVYFILSLAVPIVLIVIFNILVARRLKIFGNFNSSSQTVVVFNRAAAEADVANGCVDQYNMAAQVDRVNNATRNVSVDVVIVTAIWTLCTIPYAVCDILRTIEPSILSYSNFVDAQYLSTGIQTLCELLLPVLYALLNDTCRKYVWKLITCADVGGVNAP